jgi:hypothetical protein
MPPDIFVKHILKLFTGAKVNKKLFSIRKNKQAGGTAQH